MRTLDYASERAEGLVTGITAPVKGLKTKSAIAGLSPDYAIQLDNFICQPDALVTRTGATGHATGFSQAPKTLMQYSSATAAAMFAAASNGIFNCTTAGAIGASVATCTNGQGKYVNFGTSAGQFMYFVNGVDTPKLYDGSTWTSITGASTPAITGPTTTDLIDVEVYRQRLYFLKKNYLGFYYLPADSVGGAATFFGIGSLCRMGGKAIGHGTWSVDGGSGPDDHYAVATSEGEVCIFNGNNPSDSTAWNYMGTFYVGKPLGPNCLVKSGGDLLYLCENGLIPLSKLLLSIQLNYAAAITNNIEPSIVNAGQLYKANAGWKVHIIPSRSLLLINVPTGASSSFQYVYNTLSKGWSSFSSWNAADFIEFQGSTYMSTGLKVVKVFSGFSDEGSNIIALCDTSYNRFGTRSQLQPILMRALHVMTAPVRYSLGIAQDFSNDYRETLYGSTGLNPGVWDTALWDNAVWGSSSQLRREWVTLPSQGGISLSTRFRIESNKASVALLAIDYKLAQQGLVT